jgi:hypothetical protein
MIFAMASLPLGVFRVCSDALHKNQAGCEINFGIQPVTIALDVEDYAIARK